MTIQINLIPTHTYSYQRIDQELHSFLMTNVDSYMYSEVVDKTQLRDDILKSSFNLNYTTPKDSNQHISTSFISIQDNEVIFTEQHLNQINKQIAILLLND